MQTVTIGGVTVEKTAALAPMASVADRAYRTLCRNFGASYTVGELCSAKALCYNDKKTFRLLSVTDPERPMAVQLFGEDPDCMAKATLIAARYKPDWIDVNMGCPVPKVAGNGCGAALMRTPEKAYAIVKAMTAQTDIPITVKIRKGWDEDSVNAPAFAKLMQDAGAAAITVHGRTKQQMYRPPVDLSVIRRVKEAVTIPVIGNGGIASGRDAAEMYEQTGCDLVMVGQASFGCPWIFFEIRSYLTTGELPPPPTLEERMNLLLQQVSMMIEDYGERSALQQARKHAGFYIKGMPGAAAFRRSCGQLSSYADLQRLVEQVLSTER